MDMTKSRQEAPVTVEHLHRILCAEYNMKVSSDKQYEDQYEINSQIIKYYIMEPTNLEQLKSRLLGTNNPDARDYFFDRFKNCLDALTQVNELADANKEQAEKLGAGAVAAGGLFAGGGVWVIRSAPAFAGTLSASSALAIGADMIFAGGICTVVGLASWWFVSTYKKEKIGLKNQIRNAEEIVSRIKMLREG